MKLIIAIVHEDDGNHLISELNKKGFLVTKLATSGGFLRSGNMTLLIGVDEEKVDEVIKIIDSKCHRRKEIAAAPASGGIAGGFAPFPVEVEVGGATIFVVDVERYEKL